MEHSGVAAPAAKKRGPYKPRTSKNKPREVNRGAQTKAPPAFTLSSNNKRLYDVSDHQQALNKKQRTIHAEREKAKRDKAFCVLEFVVGRRVSDLAMLTVSNARLIDGLIDCLRLKFKSRTALPPIVAQDTFESVQIQLRGLSAHTLRSVRSF
jgi:site-specific recombinase XerD